MGNHVEISVFLLGLVALVLINRIVKLMKTQADMQASLDNQKAVIEQVEVKVAALEEAATAGAVDLTAQVDQADAQTARLQALLP